MATRADPGGHHSACCPIYALTLPRGSLLDPISNFLLQYRNGPSWVEGPFMYSISRAM